MADLVTNVTAIPPLAQYLSLEASSSLAVSLFQASVCALQIWDIMLTYDQEIQLVWKARSSVVNYLFFIVRYLPLSLSIATVIVSQSDFKTEDRICGFYTWYATIGNCALVCTTDVLLAYRAYAFFGRDRRVLASLVILWILNFVSLLVFAVLFALKFPIVHSTTIFIRGVLGECIAVGFPQVVHDAWISELVFQSFLLLLISIKVIRLTITSWTTNGVCTFYYVFVRDELWCFLLLFAVSVVSAVQSSPAGIAFIQSAVLLLGTAGSRLILNLRNLKTVSCTGSSNTYVISTNPMESEILFAESGAERYNDV